MPRTSARMRRFELTKGELWVAACRRLRVRRPARMEKDVWRNARPGKDGFAAASSVLDATRQHRMQQRQCRQWRRARLHFPYGIFLILAL
jgi:hypothetical protein